MRGITCVSIEWQRIPFLLYAYVCARARFVIWHPVWDEVAAVAVDSVADVAAAEFDDYWHIVSGGDRRWNANWVWSIDRRRGRLSLRRWRHESLLINSETNGFTGESLGRTKQTSEEAGRQRWHTRRVGDCVERKNGDRNGRRWYFGVGLEWRRNLDGIGLE